MTILTHLLMTTAGVQAFGLEGADIFLAYGFGVAVDIDHLVKAPLYYKKHKFQKLRHYHWRTSLQEPVSLLWIVPLSIFLQTPVPIIFFLLHVFLDYFMSYEKMPFFPFSTWKAGGFLVSLSDLRKELFTIVLLACTILLLVITGY
ncbi:MAG: hypothetical protein ACE5H0_09605 [Bacteroidota bacterium]